MRHDHHPPGGSEDKNHKEIMIECNKICDPGYNGSSVEEEAYSTQRKMKVSQKWQHMQTYQVPKAYQVFRD